MGIISWFRLYRIKTTYLSWNNIVRAQPDAVVKIALPNQSSTFSNAVTRFCTMGLHEQCDDI